MPTPGDAVVATLPDIPAPGAGPELAGEGRTAILVAHGMGQQLRYQTLDMVVDGLAKAPGDWLVTDQAMSLVRVGRKDMQRVTVTIARQTANGIEERKADVYEAYWAPLTEGQVRLWDVASFLAGAAIAGLRKGVGRQSRWLFGDWRDFPPVRGATFAFSIGLLTLVSLAVMNVIAFVAVGVIDLPDVVVPPDTFERLADELTRALLAFLLVAGLLGAWIGVSLLAVRRARVRQDTVGLDRLTDAGMSMVAWGLAAAVAFLVAIGALAAAYAPCVREAGCAPGLAARGGGLLAACAVAAAGVLAPRYSRILLPWGLGALAVGAAVALWGARLAPYAPFGRAPFLPLVPAALGLLHAGFRAVKEFCAAGGQATRWYHRAFFGSAFAGMLLLGSILVFAPVFPLLAATSSVLLVVAGFATASALLGMLVGSWFARRPAWSLQGLAWAAAAVLLSGLVLLLLLGLEALRPAARSLVAWGLVAGVAVLVGIALKQYVGDVAAYVSAHKLDRFSHLRRDIDAAVKEVADAVYGMRTPDGKRLAYDRVLLVSHSLGSVVTYNTLNALLLDDQHAAAEPPSSWRTALRRSPRRAGSRASDHPRRVAERTRLLLTFGSPLDRTAFIFATRRAQRGAGLAMSSFVQPLLADPAVRAQIPWVNVHSRADIISSELTYYHLPGDAGPGSVMNVEDVAATTPLAAHVEYWRNREAWSHVVRTLFAP